MTNVDVAAASVSCRVDESSDLLSMAFDLQSKHSRFRVFFLYMFF